MRVESLMTPVWLRSFEARRTSTSALVQWRWKDRSPAGRCGCGDRQPRRIVNWYRSGKAGRPLRATMPMSTRPLKSCRTGCRSLTKDRRLGTVRRSLRPRRSPSGWRSPQTHPTRSTRARRSGTACRRRRTRLSGSTTNEVDLYVRWSTRPFRPASSRGMGRPRCSRCPRASGNLHRSAGHGAGGAGEQDHPREIGAAESTSLSPVTQSVSPGEAIGYTARGPPDAGGGEPWRRARSVILCQPLVDRRSRGVAVRGCAGWRGGCCARCWGCACCCWWGGWWRGGCCGRVCRGCREWWMSAG